MYGNLTVSAYNLTNFTFNVFIGDVRYYLNGSEGNTLKNVTTTSEPQTNFTAVGGDNAGEFRFNITVPASLAFGTHTLTVNATLVSITGTASSSFDIPDTTPPIVNTSLNKSLTTIRINDIINLTANATDEVELSFCQIIINQSGPDNIEIINISLSGTTGACHNVSSVILSAGNVINYTIRANDTSNNFRTNDTIITVANTAPNTPSIVFPTSDLYTNKQPLDLNVTFAADIDNDIINISYYINGKLNQTSLTNTTFNASDGYYILNVSISDSVDYSANATINFTLDTTLPNITLLLPLNRTGDRDGNITFTYNVTDTNIVNNCSLIINNKFNSTNNSVTRNIAQNFTLTNTGIGSYNWSINCTDKANNTASSSVRRIGVVRAFRFNGTSTDLTTVDLRNITNLTFENSFAGKINFTSFIDLSGGADVNRYINISFNRIEINSTALPALNKSATLHLYGLTFSNPRISRDGSVCPSSICTKLSFTGGNLTFNVTHFTVYSSEETPTTEKVAAAAAAAAGNGGASGSGIIPIEKVLDFTIDKKTLKVVIRQGQVKEELLNIKNTGNVPLNIEIEQENLENLLVLSHDSFSLKAGESKTIRANIFASETQKAGVYTGRLRIKSDGKEEVVVVIIEVKEKTALFDIKVEVKKIEIRQGDEVEAEISLLNLGDLKPVDIELYYAIRDIDGNDIVFGHDTFAVEDEKIVKRELKLPADLEPGIYLFYTEVRYNGKVASSVDIINVKEGKGFIKLISKAKNLIASTWIFILIIVLAITYYNFGTQINKKLEKISPFGRREIRKPYIRKPTREIIPSKPKLLHKKKYVEKEPEILRRKPKIIEIKPIKRKSVEVLERERLTKQLKEWKSKSYDTTLLEAELKGIYKTKLKSKPTKEPEKDKLLNQLKEWKAKGYDTTLLEAELRGRYRLKGN